MIKSSSSQYLSAGFMSVILLSLMYSFGTFGFLNLFGARGLVQALLLSIISLLFITMRVRFKNNHFFLLFLFSFTYIFVSLMHGGSFARLSDVYILIFCFVLIFYSPPKNIVFFSKMLVIATTVLCSLVAIAAIYYQIYPDEFLRANFTLYSSEVGQARIYPGNFIDFISFTSGDGFDVLGHSISRMKGYSNEPSSTPVHYVAPAALAFMLGGRFSYLGIFILAVSMLAIFSFITYIVIALSLVFLAMKFIPKVLSKALIFLLICSFLFFIFNEDLILTIFRITSSILLDYAGIDFLHRKIGDGSFGTKGSNLGERHHLILNGLSLIPTSPFGYSQERFGAASGVLYIISARSGWIGVFIFGIFIINLVKNIKTIYFTATSPTQLFGLSLVISILLVNLFISGYGWSRPPGIIIFLIYFRFLQLLSSESNTSSNLRNSKLFNNFSPLRVSTRINSAG